MGEVGSVSADLTNLSSLELDVEDNAELIFRFQNGSRATIHLDYYQRPPSHTLDLTLEGGSISWDNASGIAKVTDAWNKTERTITPPPDFTRNAMFLAEMDAFVRLCQGEDLPHCTLADGKRVQKLWMSPGKAPACEDARCSCFLAWSDGTMH